MSEPQTPARGGGDAPVHLDDESIEAVAQRIAELIRNPKPAPLSGPNPLVGISAREVARVWEVSRRWVYENADELGARRLLTDNRPRLRFDPAKVAALLGAPEEEPGARGLAAMRGDSETDSLSSPGGANVARQARRPAGRTKARRRSGAARAARFTKDGPRGSD